MNTILPKDNCDELRTLYTLNMKIGRRKFFTLFPMAASAALWLQRRDEDMIVRSTRPEDLEMPISGFDDYITPVERFFVRTHDAVPKVDIAQWRLTVDGNVGTPLTLTMDDLRKMPS